MKKLIFLDLDGTVIGAEGVTERTWRAIDSLKKSHRLAVCTGRTRAGVAARIAERMDPVGPHVFENGGLIGAVKSVPWFSSALDLNDLELLIQKSETVDATLEFYTAEGVFCSRDHPDCRKHAEVLDIVIEVANLREIAQSIPVIRAHWIMRPDVMEQVLSVHLLASELGVARSPVLPENVFASVTAKGVSKGTAVRFVAERLGISVEDAFAVGDSEGDRPMLEVVGHPIVMGDASPSLLKDFPSIGEVDAEGLAIWLESIDLSSQI